MDNVLEGRLQRGEISMAEIAEEEDNLNKTCLMHTPYIWNLYIKITSKKWEKGEDYGGWENKKRKSIKFSSSQT